MEKSFGGHKQAKKDCLGRERWRLTCRCHPHGGFQLLEGAWFQRQVDVDMIDKCSEWENDLEINRLIKVDEMIDSTHQ